MPIIYVRLKKAMYGILRSSLPFYRKLRGELKAYGFRINPYDPCVGNKMVTTETVVIVIDKKGRIIRDKNGSDYSSFFYLSLAQPSQLSPFYYPRMGHKD